jgi:signal transduction histidine kinase
MSGTAFGTTALMMVLQARWRYAQPQGQWAHAGAAVIAALIGLNSTLHLFLTNDVLQSSNLLLLVVCVGFFFLSSFWLAGALGVIYCCWGMATLTIAAAPGQWTHFTFGLVSASVLAVSAHIARKRALRRVAFLRLQDKQRTKQLQEALTAEQAIEEALRQSETRYRLLYDEVEQRAQELHRVNTQLAQAVRVKDEFLASVSHELRTPLTAILGLTESLQEDIYGPLTEQQQGVLHNIDQSGRHLLALITDILDVAKIEAGQFTLDLGPAAVDAVCQASLMLTKQKAQRKQIQITTAFDRAVKIIETDDRRLKQILVNLLDNAIKFTPEGGAVGLEVKGDAENKVIHFVVWDTGIGIAPEDLKHVFDRYYQVKNSRSDTGTGIGLTLALELARWMQGDIQVESEVGRGTTFVVYLPVLSKPGTGTAAAWVFPSFGKAPAPIEEFRKEEAFSEEGKPRLLLVEDSADVLQYLQLCLRPGYQLQTATNGRIGLEMARDFLPDLIISDVMMPEMDGMVFCGELKQDICTSRDIGFGCEFSRIMTYAFHAWHKDHGARAYTCKHLGVVARTTWHPHDGVPVIVGDLFNERDDSFIKNNGFNFIFIINNVFRFVSVIT